MRAREAEREEMEMEGEREEGKDGVRKGERAGGRELRELREGEERARNR